MEGLDRRTELTMLYYGAYRIIVFRPGGIHAVRRKSVWINRSNSRFRLRLTDCAFIQRETAEAKISQALLNPENIEWAIRTWHGSISDVSCQMDIAI